MAGFLNVDYKKAVDTSILSAGTYEMGINTVKGDASPGGHERMVFDMIVRKDLDKVPELAKTNAKHHGQHLFVRVWTAKDANGNDTGSYKQSDLNYIAKAVGIPDGADIKTQDDFMRMCENRTVRVQVGVNDDEYKGEKRKKNSCFVNTWRPTKYPLQGSQPAKQADPFQGNKGSETEINDNDLPF